jgi:NADPH:quinone reductase-like Zn-dependent oxidoreductase
MCATVFDSYGGPDVLCLRNEPLPEQRDGDVLILVGYAGVNPADSKARSADLGVN